MTLNPNCINEINYNSNLKIQENVVNSNIKLNNDLQNDVLNQQCSEFYFDKEDMEKIEKILQKNEMNSNQRNRQINR